MDEAFEQMSVNNLAQYMGGELTVNPPTDESSYATAIKIPMELIFNQIKTILQKKLNKPIYNKVYEPMNDKLFLLVALTGRYGNYFFNSIYSDSVGLNANTFKNSPLQNNTILSHVFNDGSYAPWNANLFPSQMEVLSDNDPKFTATSFGYHPMSSYKCVGYRACRKLINDYTGIVGGVLVINLFNVTPDTI